MVPTRLSHLIDYHGKTEDMTRERMPIDKVIPRTGPCSFRRCKRCNGQMFQGYTAWEWNCLQCGHVHYTEDRRKIPEERYV